MRNSFGNYYETLEAASNSIQAFFPKFCSPFYFISFITLWKAQKICHWHISDKLSAYKSCIVTNCL